MTATATPVQFKQAPERTPNADSSSDATVSSVQKTGRPGVVTIIVMALVAVIGIGIILYAWNLWPFAGPVVTTDDSYVRGRVTTLSPQVTGYVAEVDAQDYQRVEAGQEIVKIDDVTYKQQLDKAEGSLEITIANLDNVQQTIAENDANIAAKQAALASARAELVRAHAARVRSDDLAAKGISTTADVEQSVATERTAQASIDEAAAAVKVAQTTRDSTVVSKRVLEADVKTARADRDTAQTNLERTVIRAPQAGQLGAISARVGQYVTSGTSLVSLVPYQTWIIANFKETQMDHMEVGQPATTTVDALGGAVVTGIVEEISPAAGSEFSVLQADNASGNFTKVVQRIPVKIRLTSDAQKVSKLRPGMSVRTSVDKSKAVEVGKLKISDN